MTKEVSHNIRLGIFVIAGLLLLVVGLYFIGSNKNMFGSSIKLYATFQNVSGLQSGNNVRYAGIDVGTVEGIEIINDTVIRVEMSVKADLKRVVRKNSVVSVGTDGLMGNKLINIETGTPDAILVSEGDELASKPTLNTEEMLRTLDYTNENVAIISSNLKNITSNIDKSRGTLYTILLDTTIARGVNRTINNIESVSNKLTQITNELSSMIHDVNQGKGLAGTLIKDTTITVELQKAIREVREGGEQINSSASELKQTIQKMNSGNGTIGTLINDTATANHLKRSIINIENSTKSFDENMEALKHSFLLRGYFKGR